MNWKIDNILFSDYGVHVESAIGALDLPRLDVPSHNWLDDNGTRFTPYSDDILKKDHAITLRCWIRGSSYADFKSKVTAFWNVLKATGERQLSCDYIPTPINVSVQSTVRLARQAGYVRSLQVGTFSLRFTVQGDSPYKNLIVYKSDDTQRETVQYGKDFAIQDRLHGECYASGKIESNDPLTMQRGDYVLIDGQKFFLYEEPALTKESTNKYEYSVKFEHEFFKLRLSQFRNLDRSEFYGWWNADQLIDQIVTNGNRRFTGVFKKGTVDTTIYKNHHFSSQDCLTALRQIAETYELEYSYKYDAGQIEISLVSTVGNSSGVSMQYGVNNGLYRIRRDSVDSKELVTVLYAEGADKNLPFGYGSLRLQMPSGTTALISNETLYGEREKTKVFNDIFPEKVGVIDSYTEITDANEHDLEQYILVDAELDFDINDYLVPNVSAKIHFKTGDCAGYTFEIKRYKHSEKKIWFLPFRDDAGNKMPTASLKPAMGDEYVLIDIYLPTSYVTDAENRLLAGAQAYMAENNVPKITYRADVDPFFIQNLIQGSGFVQFRSGDEVTINDSDFNLTNYVVRIVDLNRKLFDNSYTLTLSQKTVKTKAEDTRILNEKVDKVIENGHLDDVDTKRRSKQTSKEIEDKILDPIDMKLDPEVVRDQSLDPVMLAWDAGYPQVSLKDTLVEPNYLDDEDKVNVGNGSITIHNFYALNRYKIAQAKATGTYDPTRTWAVTGGQTTLPTKSAHWLYAKINLADASTECTLEWSEDHKESKLDIETGYLRYKLGYVSAASSPRYACMVFGNVKVPRGFSAYEVAVQNGFSGTEPEWLDSLIGPQGSAGSQGAQGDQGAAGSQGPQGSQGFQGLDGIDGVQGPQGVAGSTGPQGTQGAQGAQGIDGSLAEYSAILFEAKDSHLPDPDTDNLLMYSIASGTSPNRLLKLIMKDELGNEVILSTLIN